MITINLVKYNNYYEMCKAYNINYKEFIRYKKNNSDISELELLNHFFPNIKLNMSNNTYSISSKK